MAASLDFTCPLYLMEWTQAYKVISLHKSLPAPAKGGGEEEWQK